MQLKKGDFCPFIQGPCKQLECVMFTHIRGHNPNTGEEVDEYNCSLVWMPMLMIENSQQQRQTGAAVESFRNEMVKANDTNKHVLLSAIQHSNPNIKFIEG